MKNKVLLITGGTGSFGECVLSSYLDTDIKEIRIFSRDEKKQNDLRIKYTNPRLKFYIGDVRDKTSLREAFYGVNYVFHAAALKQVPSCEFFPMEAVKTNVYGTSNVLDVAIEAGVEKVVCLSTDKAVYPVNAMGISKALMEKVAIAKSRAAIGKTTICITRYGNVMNSRGSVIPLFLKNARDNQSLPITDPSMTRFIMSLKEAMQLVFFAMENGESGDLFIQKSPSCTVGDLAKAIQIYVNVNVGTKLIGIRHGEKLYEVLMTAEEASKAIELGKYFKISSDKRSLTYNELENSGDPMINKFSEYNSNNTNILSVDDIVETLRSDENLDVK